MPPSEPVSGRTPVTLAPDPSALDTADTAGEGNGDPYGFGAALTAALFRRAGSGPDELRALAPRSVRLPFDPSRARYLDTIVHPKIHGEAADGGLDAAEQAALKKFGFVVSERLSNDSFGEAFLEIYGRDQPVFVSADAVLHAWHRSFDTSLAETEGTMLAPRLLGVLTAMQDAIALVGADLGPDAELSPSLDDADVLLSVACALLDGGSPTSHRGQDARVAGLLKAVAAEQTMHVLLFGRGRLEDFSQYKPRGHYTQSPELGRYFRAAMWLGRMDLRVAGPGGSPRELGAALVLRELLQRSGQQASLARIADVAGAYVGPTDSMTFDDLDMLASLSNAKRLGDVDSASLAALEDRIHDTSLAAQLIQSHPYESDPLAGGRRELPRSFTVLGQRFTVDSWATSELVHDRVLVDGRPVARELPSGLDVAFTALRSDAAADILAARIEATDGQAGRDGLPIAAQLLAVRDALDERAPALLEATVYGQWQLALRALSKAPPAGAFTVARTPAWRRRVLQGQLASWAELRHDTVRYVKQSFTTDVSCEYPAGYVEPNVAFWQALGNAAKSMATMFSELSTGASTSEAAMFGRDAEFYSRFARTVLRLEGVARAQRSETPLSTAQTSFLKDLMYETHGRGGYGRSVAVLSGWYPDLFLAGRTDAKLGDALVADVHSSGLGNLLVATGAADRLVAVVDNGSDLMAYTGPVFSYYEWAARERLTDQEWRARLHAGEQPAREEWTQGWLVTGDREPRHTVPPPRASAVDAPPPDFASVKIDVGDMVDADVQSGEKGNILRVLKKSQGRIRLCVELAFKVNPAVKGRVSAGWSIVDGRVTEAHLVSNNTGVDAVGKCVLSSVRGMRFFEDTTATVAEFAWVVSQ